MGAIGSSRIVASRPDLFDAIGALGGPLDAALILHNIEYEHLGGFCSPAQLEAAAAADKLDNGNRMDRLDRIAGCAQTNPTPLTKYSRSQRFNHWAFTLNGGHFDRGFYLEVFGDLAESMGNPVSHNPHSPSLASPIKPEELANISCASPYVVHNVIDRDYSPHGEHNAITFCDGQPPLMLCDDGTQVDWCAAAALQGRALAQYSDASGFCATHGGNAHEANEHSSNPAEVDLYFNHMGENLGCYEGNVLVPFVLAIDINGNGRRDLNEPLLLQGHEPFSDVGVDGCPDKLEAGDGGCTTAELSPFARGVADPNGDNYNPQTNPAGTEGNWKYDLGEPFEDVGLDGVAGTSDEGEGDGKFTMSPGYAHWFAQDLRSSLPTMTAERKAGLDFYFEGGIRDVFDLGAQAEALAGGVKLAVPTPALTRFEDFPDIPSASGLPWTYGEAPGSDPENDFNPLSFDISALGRNTLVLYGNPNASVADIRAGNGDHVGSLAETYDRFAVFFQWLSARWDPVLGPPKPFSGAGVNQMDLVLHSTTLGADWAYSVMLPPGYNDPANATKRYPVAFVLHGYGMTSTAMAGTGAVPNVLATSGLAHPMITVFPSGQCCWVDASGDKACLDSNDAGVSYQSLGYQRECDTGSFFVDRQGVSGTAEDKTQYAQAIIELMGVIDHDYRTLPPANGQAF